MATPAWFRFARASRARTMVEGQRQSSISCRDVDGFREGLKGIGHRFETPCRRASARACPDESSYVARHSAACKRLAIGIGRWQCSVAPATMLEHPFADGNGRTAGGAVTYVVLGIKLDSMPPCAPTIPRADGGRQWQRFTSPIWDMARHQRRGKTSNALIQRRSWTVHRLGPEPTSPVWLQV
jgi:hypothetical protein